MSVGARQPTLATPTVTATTITLSWTLQQYSLDVTEYRISATRLTGSDDNAMLCSDTDTRPVITVAGTADSLSVMFDSLHEFSTYRVTLTTQYDAIGTIMNVDTPMDVNTLSVGE